MGKNLPGLRDWAFRWTVRTRGHPAGDNVGVERMRKTEVSRRRWRTDVRRLREVRRGAGRRPRRGAVAVVVRAAMEEPSRLPEGEGPNFVVSCRIIKENE